jgi:hypothetical protein
MSKRLGAASRLEKTRCLISVVMKAPRTYNTRGAITALPPSPFWTNEFKK